MTKKENNPDDLSIFEREIALKANRIEFQILRQNQESSKVRLGEVNGINYFMIGVKV